MVGTFVIKSLVVFTFTLSRYGVHGNSLINATNELSEMTVSRPYKQVFFIFMGKFLFFFWGVGEREAENLSHSEEIMIEFFTKNVKNIKNQVIHCCESNAFCDNDVYCIPYQGLLVINLWKSWFRCRIKRNVFEKNNNEFSLCGFVRLMLKTSLNWILNIY